MTNLNRICGKKGCSDVAVYKTSSGGFYCPKHSRFITMRSKSQQTNKYQPTFEALEKLLIQCGPEMRCPNCNKKMIWRTKLGKRRNVVSLQHNNDGTIQFLCHACNVGHGNSQLGDRYFDLKQNEKYCSSCKRILTKNQFYKDVYSVDKICYICKKCCHERYLKR